MAGKTVIQWQVNCEKLSRQPHHDRGGGETAADGGSLIITDYMCFIWLQFVFCFSLGEVVCFVSLVLLFYWVFVFLRKT